MLIDFSDIEEKPLEHFKGGEGTFFARMFTDSKVKIMRGRLEHGASILRLLAQLQVGNQIVSVLDIGHGIVHLVYSFLGWLRALHFGR